MHKRGKPQASQQEFHYVVSQVIILTAAAYQKMRESISNEKSYQVYDLYRAAGYHFGAPACSLDRNSTVLNRGFTNSNKISCTRSAHGITTHLVVFNLASCRPLEADQERPAFSRGRYSTNLNSIGVLLAAQWRPVHLKNRASVS
jgi:hypothetical protein